MPVHSDRHFCGMKKLSLVAQPVQVLTSLLFASFLRYFGNSFANTFPQQQATCTRGPSFPRLKPAATANIILRDLIISVHSPKYPWIIKPPSIVLILRKGNKMLNTVPIVTN